MPIQNQQQISSDDHSLIDTFSVKTQDLSLYAPKKEADDLLMQITLYKHLYFETDLGAKSYLTVFVQKDLIQLY